jgi:hypothetical protein
MKSPVMLLAALIVLLATIPVVGFGQEKYSPKPNEELYGTWINSDQFSYSQKSVNGFLSYKEYWRVTDSVPSAEGKDEIYAKWTDSEGNIWYRLFSTGTSGIAKGYSSEVLSKISKSGTVRELVYSLVTTFDPDDFPTKIDPEDSTYRIYYRAEK